MKKTLIISGAVIVLAGLFLWIGSVVRENKVQDGIIESLIYVQKGNTVSMEEYKQDFINKCIQARAVYQWHWYQKYATKLGNLRLKKRYAMTLDEYDALIQLSWELNRELCIAPDDWRNYVVIAKWILESAMHEKVKHKTGEVIAFTGYMPATVWTVYKVYKFEVKPVKGSPFYIYELHKSDPDFESIFNELEHVVRFDYMYFRWLLERYEFNWEFATTAFHFGLDKTDFWWSVGLKNIPRHGYRGIGKWERHYMKQYYQTVYEIAQSIATGELTRPSRMVKTIGVYRKVNEFRKAYIDNLRLQIKYKDNTETLQQELKELQDQFDNYKKVTEEIITTGARMNNLRLDYKHYKREQVKEQYYAMRDLVKEKYYAWKEGTE